MNNRRDLLNANHATVGHDELGWFLGLNRIPVRHLPSAVIGCGATIDCAMSEHRFYLGKDAQGESGGTSESPDQTTVARNLDCNRRDCTTTHEPGRDGNGKVVVVAAVDLASAIDLDPPVPRIVPQQNLQNAIVETRVARLANNANVDAGNFGHGVGEGYDGTL